MSHITPPNVNSNFPLSGSDGELRIVDELAELIGERYTLDARLQWIDEKLTALKDQLAELRR